ncbi:MAG TPA: FtsH protease activity modulator HflK [Solimonas sp.]
MAWNEPGPPSKDPWSQGPKRGEGPPDLDEMLKRLKARFGGRKRGGGSGGNGGGGSALGGGLPPGVVGLALGAIAVLWVSSGFYVVDEQERAVVLRFGQYINTTEPGLRWRLPWPIDKQEIVNVTGVRAVRDRATMLTMDENIVDVELSVQYRVSSVEDYVFSVADPDMALRQATKSAVREVAGQSLMDFILTGGRQEVADRTKQLLQDRLDAYKTGLIVTEVNLEQAQPPEPVKASFDDAIKAREDQERVKNEAQAYANDRLPRARGAAARLIEEANGYRDQVIAKAEGDAARFGQLVNEYRKAPRVTRERLYLDTMSQVLGLTSKVMIDVDKGNPMIYLPLDQILKNSGARTTDVPSDYVTAPSSGSGVPRLTPGPADSARSRERGR